MKYFFLSLFLLVAGLLHAQKGSFDLNAEGGPGYTNMFGNQLLESYNNPRMGYAAGVGIQYNFSKLFSVRLAPTFQNTGLNYDVLFVSINQPEGTKGYSTYNWIAFPLTARISFGNSFKFFASAGGYYATLMGASLVLKPTENFSGSSYDIINNFRRSDYGLTGGIGVRQKMGKSCFISFEAKANYGLYNLAKGPVYKNGTIQNFSAYALVGFGYTFGKKDSSKDQE